MDYKEALQYIEDSKKYGSVLGLNNIKELLKRLGNPERQLKIVHVAGTNGKGSVIAFLDEILKCAGYKVGTYLSPPVDDYREIIQVNGKWISGEDIAEHLTKIRDIADVMGSESYSSSAPEKMRYSHPTLYEMETAMAFLHFIKTQCDIVLLETGMGGSMDATNVSDIVLCSVITSISIDHVQFLGNSIEEIAMCKAGIIKKGCPVVLGIQEKRFEKQVIKVISSVADEKNCGLILTKKGKVFDMNMLGTFQQDNAACAAEVAGVLKKEGFAISDENVADGIKNARRRGRFEMICDNPKIVIDGAHNPSGAAALAKSIEMYFTNEPIIFIMGVLADKDYMGIVRQTAHMADMIYTVTPDNERALDGKELKKTVRLFNDRVEYKDSIEAALFAACSERDRVVIAFGSLTFLGAIRKITSLLKP